MLTHSHLWAFRRTPLFQLPTTAPRSVSVFDAPALAQAKARRKARTPHVVRTPVMDRESDAVRKMNILSKRPHQETLFALEEYIELTELTRDDTLRQTVLPDLPPAPRRKEKPLPMALVVLQKQLSTQYHAGAWAGHEAKSLARVIKQMTFDSVIYAGDWRVELIDCEKGQPHYRLFFGAHIVGIVNIPVDWRHGQSVATCPETPRIQANFARYLVGCGFTAEMARQTLTSGMSRTKYGASKRGLYRLLKATQSDKGDRE